MHEVTSSTCIATLWSMHGVLSDNIVLSIIAIKSQYRNRDISESESCDTSHVFALQRWQKAISSFLPLEDANSAVWNHFGFPARNGKILESDRKKRQVVYCKLFLIKQLS